jgi:potassium-transporting ATPase ATP-binding subunit
MRVTSEPGKSFLDRMIALIEGSQRQKTPNEIALSVLLSSLTFVFLLTVISLKLFTNYSLIASNNSSADRITVPVLIALLVCLIPTTISALMTAVGIAGIDRLTRFNVIAKSGRAVEASGDIDLLIVDKTGTITLGNRLADEFIPIEGVTETQLADIAQLASLSDETPEGRSIVILAKSRYGLRGENIRSTQTQFFPFTAKQRMSGIDILGDNNTVIQSIRKGSPDAIKKHIESAGGFIPPSIDSIIQKVAQQGGTPLLVSENKQILGVIFLKDMIKGGIKNRFKEFRNGGIHTLMITGDNPLTAAAIAAEAGIDDFVAEATPEDKLKIIRKAQNEGHLVAMTGDGTNDAPALAQADVGVAMNSGTAATREAGNMVDLDNNPLKLIEIVKIGKQMLITRGALTTFSMCNDIAKYFAIIPALFKNLYPSENGVLGPLRALDIMHLHTTESAILSAVIFNALVIIALIPLALRGVHFKVQKASSLLKRNLLIYGLGGVMIPFIGIKLIDMLITSIGLL